MTKVKLAWSCCLRRPWVFPVLLSLVCETCPNSEGTNCVWLCLVRNVTNGPSFCSYWFFIWSSWLLSFSLWSHWSCDKVTLSPSETWGLRRFHFYITKMHFINLIEQKWENKKYRWCWSSNLIYTDHNPLFSLDNHLHTWPLCHSSPLILS